MGCSISLLLFSYALSIESDWHLFIENILGIIFFLLFYKILSKIFDRIRFKSFRQCNFKPDNKLPMKYIVFHTYFTVFIREIISRSYRVFEFLRFFSNSTKFVWWWFFVVIFSKTSPFFCSNLFANLIPTWPGNQ